MCRRDASRSKAEGVQRVPRFHHDSWFQSPRSQSPGSQILMPRLISHSARAFGQCEAWEGKGCPLTSATRPMHHRGEGEQFCRLCPHPVSMIRDITLNPKTLNPTILWNFRVALAPMLPWPTGRDRRRSWAWAQKPRDPVSGAGRAPPLSSTNPPPEWSTPFTLAHSFLKS